MAVIKILSDIDLKEGQLLNTRTENLSTDPIVNVPGKLYYNTELKNIKVGDGNNWKILGEDSETSGIKKYKQNIGDGTNNYFLINHNLSTEDISISIFEGKELVICDVEIRDLNNIIVRTADIPEENSLKVVVIG